MLQGSLGPKTQNLKYAQAGVPAANLMPCPNSGAALRPAKLDSGHPGFNPSGGNMGPNDPSGAARRFLTNKPNMLVQTPLCTCAALPEGSLAPGFRRCAG